MSAPGGADVLFFRVLVGEGDPEAAKSPASKVGETFLSFLTLFLGQRGMFFSVGESPGGADVLWRFLGFWRGKGTWRRLSVRPARLERHS